MVYLSKGIIMCDYLYKFYYGTNKEINSGKINT